ncbi:YdbH domain-containing protein [Altererythrobacter arenosus]|uniref:YdbH domain-containing protein n=1 Tax=Altererythrobacter arenosus TaxID=3032592 RepID=A0ABY8FRA8_9SPHN|nr:YdbH domain-containing protein [Altererythrobacter sp. CAU 1644]WFL76765.1 YdbH domain-containing protein [Altererythrobacter sp. CAU 1644]
MADAEEPILEPESSRRLWPRRKRWRTLIVFCALIFGGILLGWLSRERIATNIIEDQLQQMGLPATYDVGEIRPDHQVLENVVIGDPDQPDLTIERVKVHLRYRFGTPAIGRVELVRPRLFGSYRKGKLSFGSLDPVIFAESDEPPGLPDLDLLLVDGRALIETDYGPIGIKAEGEGELDDGFRGIIAAVAPNPAGGGCRAERASLYSRVVVGGGKPKLEGPLRLRSLICEQGPRVAGLDTQVEAVIDKDLAGLTATVGVDGKRLGYADYTARALGGSVVIDWRKGLLNAKYDLAARSFDSPQVGLDRLALEGNLRARNDFDRAELEAKLAGESLALGPAFNETLAGLRESGKDTLLAPLLGRMQTGLANELPGGEIFGELSLRKSGKRYSGAVPNFRIEGASGVTLFALSQAQFSTQGEGAPRLTGNIFTGGANIPNIRGRMERGSNGALAMRLRMEEFGARDSALAIPELVISQSPNGALGFAGEVRATGPIPGGAVRSLTLPVSGNWSAAGGLSMWRKCTDIRFDQLRLADLSLARHGLRLCPSSGNPIVKYDRGGLKVAAGIPALDLSGLLADTPLRLRSGAIGFAWPGAMSAKNVDIALGPAPTASRFTISELDATFGDEIGGRFNDADVSLDAVPLDLRNVQGNWRYAGGVLAINDANFRLIDREAEARFKPLEARDGSLTLQDNIIDAQAELRHPGSDRIVTAVTIRHNLGTSSGFADLDVAGLKFDEALQPEDLTELAKGVIALADGTVTGTGRIDWNEREITSSGAFSSDGIDFAAAFGPVKGASGTIVFDDLLNLTTAPGQTLKIASVNPGIEVFDGEISFDYRDGQFLSVRQGTWPFMGGTLTLRPVDLNLGISEQRSYVFVIEGLDAGVFVAKMELGNISASGTFDGEVPITFDIDGNGKIDGGQLVSRPPGGNLSYVGELTYEDMGTMANFAFQSLRSLDYQVMTVNMNGNLAGEIITEVRFEGVSQGEGTKKNFFTRQIAGLPLEFRVNIRAAFAQLLTNLRSLYDPAFVKDPRELGLLTDDGRRLQRQVSPPPEAIKPEDLIPDESPVQNQESESMP